MKWTPTLESLLESLEERERLPEDPSLPRIRTSPEDFFVEEIPLDEEREEGDVLYLWIEKRLLNTEDVARRLAQVAGKPVREVGYAGRKDRRAVARQWFSVPGLTPEGAAEAEGEDLRILRTEWGRRPLRVGMLAGNRFRIAVRGLAPEPAAEALERLERVRRHGLPNRFGTQRFGSRGRNLVLGMQLLRGERVKGDRRTRSFVVSALQAAVFNEVLRRRTAPVHELVAGDLALVHDEERLELVTEPEAQAERLERFEISPTGPLFGFKVRQPGPRVADFEHQVLDDFGLGDLYGLEPPWGVRLFGGRRSLRARVFELESRYAEAESTLWLEFRLDSGSYATTLLEECLPGGYWEER